jgi:hypothetical protein
MPAKATSMALADLRALARSYAEVAGSGTPDSAPATQEPGSAVWQIELADPAPGCRTEPPPAPSTERAGRGHHRMRPARPEC